MSKTYSHQRGFWVKDFYRKNTNYNFYDPTEPITEDDRYLCKLYYDIGFAGCGKRHWTERAFTNAKQKSIDKAHKLEMDQIEPHYYHAKGKNRRGNEDLHRKLRKITKPRYKTLVYDGKILKRDSNKYVEYIPNYICYHGKGIIRMSDYVEDSFSENSPHLNCIHNWEKGVICPYPCRFGNDYFEPVEQCSKCGLIRKSF